MKKLAVLLMMVTVGLSTSALAFTAGTGKFYACLTPQGKKFLVAVNGFTNDVTISAGATPNLLEILGRPGARFFMQAIPGSNPQAWEALYGHGSVGTPEAPTNFLGTCVDLAATDVPYANDDVHEGD